MATAFFRIASAKTGKGFITHADQPGLAFACVATIGSETIVQVDGDPGTASAWATRVGAVAVTDTAPLRDFQARAMDAQTDQAIGAALHPFAPRGEEAAIHREQLQAIIDKLGMRPTEKFSRLAEIAHQSVAAGQETKATAAKAG